MATRRENGRGTIQQLPSGSYRTQVCGFLGMRLCDVLEYVPDPEGSTDA